ncbi:hypothetical protein EO776_16650 (plasmid) [Halorubrum ezzemoulense]|uniref:Uncharacterized protein n=1 Tax=Halorubrum ezzemoulense TaxID=337243 RepID=A0A481RK17_HALEZ|nr:hypothetical protein EO776_16650 [Halorubrum ezzemoulense]
MKRPSVVKPGQWKTSTSPSTISSRRSDGGDRLLITENRGESLALQRGEDVKLVVVTAAPGADGVEQGSCHAGG